MSSCKKIKKKFTDMPDKKSSYHCGLSKNAHSPTVKLLQNCKIIPSPEEKESATLQLSVLCDIKESVSKLKLKRCDKAREAMDFLTASFSGENVKKSRAKSSLAKKLGLPIRRISKGYKVRTKILHSELSSFT